MSASPTSSKSPSFMDRVDAIKELVTDTDAYAQLSAISLKGWTYASKGTNLFGNIAWIAITAALVLVVPLVYEIDRELGDTAAAQAISGSIAADPVIGDAATPSST